MNSRWDEGAVGNLDGLGLLVYASRLIGAETSLVVWGGEFGRTNYSQGKLTPTDYGRDHHPRCFTMFLAGAGVKAGLTYGATDDFGYRATVDRCSTADLHATMLHLFGLDYKKLIFPRHGRDERLTDVHEAKILKPILVLSTRRNPRRR